MSRPVRRLAGLGLLGTAALTASSYVVGAVPISESGPWSTLRVSGFGETVWRAVFYAGLLLVGAAWLGIGRRALDRSAPLPWRTIRRIGLLWAAPLLVAMPLGSRDLWAYAAQAQVMSHGLDPYHAGPSAVPGVFLEQVSNRWRGLPSPYGPLWMVLTRIPLALSGGSPVLCVLLLRLFAAAGFVLIAASIPTLCTRIGGRAEVGVWLAVANPLVIVGALGGGHNDLLMVGLICVGLFVATGDGPKWRTLAVAAAVLATAAAIKAPALIAVAFLVPVAAQAARRRADPVPRRGGARDHALVLLSCGAVFGAITAATGLGVGWARHLSDGNGVVTVLSLPTAAGMLASAVSNSAVHYAPHVDSAVRTARAAGLVIAGLLLVISWWAAHRANAWRWMSLALLVAVLLAPVVHPWYFSWALVLGAVAPLSRTSLSWIVGTCLALVAGVDPAGHELFNHLVAAPAAVAVLLGSRLVLRQMHPTTERLPDDLRPDDQPTLPVRTRP